MFLELGILSSTPVQKHKGGTGNHYEEDREENTF